MKKTYINPEMEIVEVRTTQFLMMSTLGTTDATGDNLAPDMEIEELSPMDMNPMDMANPMKIIGF